jgi:hypothetical protein
VAQRRVVELVDDIDGKTLSKGEAETVKFAIDGTSYEIDLSKKNADRLRRALAAYITAGRRSGRSVTQARGRSHDYDPRAVRKWAESNQVPLPARGRIPADVLAKYRAAGY